MTNKKLGNDFERQFCEMLAAEGWWVHNMAQNAAGQPADVIAAKNGKAVLVDCKVCSHKGFALSRVEDNQHLAMERWEKCGNGDAWFAIKTMDGDIMMVSHFDIQVIGRSKSVMNRDDLNQFSCTYEMWVKRACW